MRRLFYNSENNGFYDSLFNSVIPEDAIEITQEIYDEFAGATWPDGKILGCDSQGKPVWVDAPAKSPEELIAGAEAQKTRLRAIADSEIEWRQDAVEAEIATEEEISSLSEWKKYRVQLMRVDTADPNWPLPPLG